MPKDSNRPVFRKLGVIALIGLIIIVAFDITPQAHAAVQSFAPVKVGTSSTNVKAFGGGTGSNTGLNSQNTACFLASGNWVVVWINSGVGPFTFAFSTSGDGQTWTPQLNLYTTSSSNGITVFQIRCFSNTVLLTWYGGATSAVSWDTFNFANLASPTPNFATDQVLTNHLGTSLSQMQSAYDASGNFWISATAGGAGADGLEIFKSGTWSNSIATQQATPWINGQLMCNSPNQLINLNTGNFGYVDYANGFSLLVSSRLAADSACNGTNYFTPANQQGGTNCYMEEYNIGQGTNTEITSGLPTGCLSSTVSQNFAVSDFSGTGNVWAMYGSAGQGGPSKLAVSSDGGATFTNQVVTTQAGSTTLWTEAFAGISRVGGNLATQALLTEYDTAVDCATGCAVYIQLIGSAASSSGTSSAAIGLCPTKNTATTTLVNNTLYWYQGLSLGQQTVINMNSFLASDTLGGPTANTLYLVLYIGVAGSGVVNVGSPMSSAQATSFSIVKGETNQLLAFSVSKGFISTANTPWAVAILGTDKMKINASSLTGLFSTAAAGGIPPATISVQTTNVGTLYLCANFAFQNIITSTTVKTVTSTSTTTTTVGTTTITTNSNTPAQSGFWFIPMFYLLFFTGIFMGIYVLLVAPRRVGG